MRVKTSVSLPAGLLRAVDSAAGGRTNRSRYIERAVRAFVEAQSRAERDPKDIELINRHARRLNAEAADVLAYQA
jgi:metal-responsive CopG/Arc/MetJ family transcriptional regulator